MNTEDPKVSTSSLNATRFLNRSACRAFLLETAKHLRPFHPFRRVSEQTLVALNESVRMAMVNHVKRMPSKGKTL